MAKDFLSVEVVGDRNILLNIDRMPVVVQEILADKVRDWTEQTYQKVIANIDERTQERSGALAGGVDYRIDEGNGRVEGTVFIEGVKYAGAQEKGAIIPAHIIRPRNAKILAFKAASGDKVFATEVFHPGAVISPLNFMRDARREMAGVISRGIKNAIVKGIRANMRGMESS